MSKNYTWSKIKSKKINDKSCRTDLSLEILIYKEFFLKNYIFEKLGSVILGKRDGKVISHQITKKSRNKWDLLYKFMTEGRAQK